MKKSGIRYVQFLDVDKDYAYLRFVFYDGGEYRFWGRVCEDGRVVDTRERVLCRIDKEKARRFRELIAREIRKKYAVCKEVVSNALGFTQDSS